MNTLTPLDIYSAAELADETELLNQFLSPGEWGLSFPVRLIPHASLARIRVPYRDDLTIVEAYDQDATPAQRQIVEEKMQSFDEDRVLVIYDNQLIDGHHHLIAAHKLGRDVQALEILDPEDVPQAPADMPEP